MKLASLLAEYFYTHKRLDLPGIGSFVLDPSGIADPEHSKHQRAQLAENIQFDNDPAQKDTTDLVNYIASTTGKIRALASADLDSHLELARQFLNIGKPFLFEGIGTLTKLQAGRFSFIPGSVLPERIKEPVAREIQNPGTPEEQGTGFKNIFYARKQKTSKKKTLVFLLLLGSLGLALWGGYTIYKKTTSGDNENTGVVKEDEAVPANASPVTTTVVEKKDSIAVPAPVASGSYRFVVETADKTRGLYRYSTLKAYGLPIQLATTDSVNFELFFVLPASAADTSRLLDSLQLLYTPAGGKAYVTQ